MTRAVAYAEMKFYGTSERGLHGTDESQDSLVQQFLNYYIMESLILAQNERWRRG